MSDNEDNNIFEDDNSVDLVEDNEVNSKELTKNKTTITIQSDNDDDSDYEDDENIEKDLEDDDIEEDIDEEIIDGDDENGDDENDDDIKNDDDNSDDEFSDNKTKTKKNKPTTGIVTELPENLSIYTDGPSINNEFYEDDEEDENPDENYLQKFETNLKENYVSDFHPETQVQNYEEIIALTKVVRNKNNIIVDPLHKTIPVLTKYERARVLGQRTKQINNGSKPYITVPENIIDGHLIAQLELEQKRIPFIIRRPLPGGAGSEFWCLKDLEVLTM